MSSAQAYLDRINALGIDKMATTITSVPDAKAKIAQLRVVKKQLQQIKKEISADIKTIRASYQEQIPSAGSGGATTMRTLGAFGVKGMKGKATNYQADAKRQIKAKQDKALEPYEKVKLVADSFLSQTDVWIAQMDGYVLDQSQ